MSEKVIHRVDKIILISITDKGLIFEIEKKLLEVNKEITENLIKMSMILE